MSGRTKIPGMLDLAPTQDVLVHQLDRMVAQVVLPKQKQYEPDTPSPSKAWTVSPTDLAFSSYAVGRDQLRVLIVGAGFAGLSAAIACARQGMAVTVLERSSGLSPHGDAITVGSNAAKLLFRWGLGDELWTRSANGGWWLFKDSAGNPLMEENLTEFPKKYGGPCLHGHRAQFLGSLGVEARFLGVHIRLDTEVIEYYDTPSYPALVTRDEEVLEADVILIADGVNSASRELLAPRSDENLHERSKSDYSIFRAATKSDAFKSDKLTAHLLDGCTRTWMGKDAHAEITPLDGGRQIAFSLTHREKFGKASLNWRDRKPISEVLAHLGGWDPVLVRAISLFPGSLNWSLPNETPAPDWVSGGGAICFLGDSIHPMTTTTYQGGSSAIEDGATIAIALGMAGNRPKDVRLALRTFQDLRMSRVEDITAVGVEQRRAWHSYHHERDPALLPLLTLQFYHFDAELFALQNFERLARKHDKHFEVTDDAFDHVLKATGVEEKPSGRLEALFKRTAKPRK